MKNEIICENCAGRGHMEETECVCPVCDGDPVITYATVAEYARQIDECDRELVELAKADYEARSHLGAALAQTIDRDDQIIMGHVRDAFRALGGKV